MNPSSELTFSGSWGRGNRNFRLHLVSQYLHFNKHPHHLYVHENLRSPALNMYFHLPWPKQKQSLHLFFPTSTAEHSLFSSEPLVYSDFTIYCITKAKVFGFILIVFFCLTCPPLLVRQLPIWSMGLPASLLLLWLCLPAYNRIESPFLEIIMITSKLDTLPPDSLSSNNLLLTAYPHTNKKLNPNSNKTKQQKF